MYIFALEGYGLGRETVWPQGQYYPLREGYTFQGWFNNPYFAGEPYTNETPIYHEANLFAKWQYSGPGGVWPRVYRGIIHGFDKGDTLYAGQNLEIIAKGYNIGTEYPQDKRFRWMPISWRLPGGASGVLLLICNSGPIYTSTA
ncbi:MAG: InlB B-repeat-containing protein [Defluviitaleaceae bacterium]|nr:InlB B-repeat-containing protein [Defluviitaleaceae bacterium]